MSLSIRLDQMKNPDINPNQPPSQDAICSKYKYFLGKYPTLNSDKAEFTGASKSAASATDACTTTSVSDAAKSMQGTGTPPGVAVTQPNAGGGNTQSSGS
jgi:hypothetical protein